LERERGCFGGPAQQTAMPKLNWPKLDHDHSYAHVRDLRTLLEQQAVTKLAITYVKWFQRKEKTKKGTRERRIAHYMELYFHRKWDTGFGQRNPLNAKQKHGIRWAREQLKKSE
jgi:hypothetical protein